MPRRSWWGPWARFYAPEKKDEEKSEAPTPTLGEDLKEIAVSFGVAAKTAVTTILGIGGAAEEEEDQTSLKAAVGQAFTPLSAYAFMCFVLLYMPCVVVAIAMRQEFGSWKWFGVAFLYQTVLAWGVAFIVYQGGLLLGLGG